MMAEQKPFPPEGLDWHTPPVNQAQIVEVSYAADPWTESYWRRTWDHSDNSFDYEVCSYRDAPVELDWQPWNEEPRGLRFKPVPGLDRQ